MRKSLWLVLAVLLSSSVAMADSIEVYTVTGTTSNPAGTIGGTITIDSTTESVNFDLSLPGPVVFTDSISLADQTFANGSVTLADPSGALKITFPGISSLNGGLGDVAGSFILTADVAPDTDLTATGTFTPAATPEASSLTLSVLGLGALLVMRKRFVRGLLPGD